MVKLKSTQPFFSIIIPTLNEEKFLPILLQCLQKQNYKNFEVFVVDAHSEDRTQRVVNSFQKKINHLKLIKSCKRHLSFQRNLGAKKASASYLVFIDADSSFGKDTFKKLHSYIRRQQPDLFITKIDFSSAKTIYRLLAFLGNLFFEIANKLKRNLGIGAFLGIKTNIFRKVGGFNEKLVLSEEHNLIKEARKFNHQFELIKTTTIYISPRRMEKEGLVKFWLKYLYFIIYEHLNGPIHKIPLKYPMGGSYYE